MNDPRFPFPGRRHFCRAIFVVALTLASPLAALGADLLAEDFATLTDTAVPAGWTTSGSSDLDYVGEAYAGAAIPSYKFKATGQWLASPAFAAGATVLRFWAYGNGGAGTLAVSGLVAGAWTLVDTKTIAPNQATYQATLNPQTTQLKFAFTKNTNNCALDDIVVQGASEDPDLVCPSALAFGALAPGAAATQILALANSGATRTLHLTSPLSPVGGDTAKFSVGPIPATLAPGATAAVSVVYSPGAAAGVSHSATFRLVSDDPSTPSNPVVFSGATIGAALTVSNIQYSASGGASPYTNSHVAVSGIATYADPGGYAIADAGGGPWSGIYVADLNHRPELGDQVFLRGRVTESNSMTVLTAVSNYNRIGSGLSVAPTPIRGNQVATEAYEGVYIRVTNVTVKNINYNSAETYWQAGDASGNFLVATRVPYRYIWHLHDALDAIQGVVHVNGASISVSPRNDWDLVGRPVFEYALRGLVMTPEGPRTNWYVHVQDDLIMAVTNVAPPGVALLDTGGIIFPGLIDAHNHPGWNSFPTLMFNDFPFGHRNEWAATSEYSEWKSRQSAVQAHAAVSDSSRKTIFKYAECLELMAGCIAIQGSSSDPEYSHPDVILYNVEQFPSRVWANIFPWETSAGTRSALLAKIDGGAVNAAIIHLCEGVDQFALDQFAQWRDWGMLNEATTIIHGAALGASEFAQMAAVGAKLVWSPMSNMKLYGGTANAKAAKEAGVVIGLSPDWTASGCYNILEELGYAWQLNATVFSNAFTAREMCEMVYRNTALCAGLGDRYGQIAVGGNAGLAVIEGDTADPYMALIRARPPNVLLTIVDGTPRYGEPALMAALGVAGEPPVDIRGRSKVFNIAVNHPFLTCGNTTFAQLRSALQTAHGTLTTTAMLNRDELQFMDLHLLQGEGGDDIAPFRADNPISNAPLATVFYDQGSNLTVRFRYRDFWDNDTYLTNLTHTISIAPARYSNLLVQTIATHLPNTPAREAVPFTVAFQDMHTNYVFVFETRDAQGNVRTTVATNTFKLTPHAGGDTDRDGMPNEWEIAHFGGFSNALATGNADGDPLNNLEEYIALTVPTNPASCFSVEAIDASAPGTMQIHTPVPTSTGRVYDVWRATNLLGPVSWQPLGLDVRGAPDGSAVALSVTNTLPGATYRVGVKLPSP